MPVHVSSTCAHHQEVKIALHSLWYHHNYRWPSRAQVEINILWCTVSKTSKTLHVSDSFSLQHQESSTVHTANLYVLLCVQWKTPDDGKRNCPKHVEFYSKIRGCVIQFWPPDDEHVCSKHVEAWNRTYCETNFVHQVG